MCTWLCVFPEISCYSSINLYILYLKLKLSNYAIDFFFFFFKFLFPNIFRVRLWSSNVTDCLYIILIAFLLLKTYNRSAKIINHIIDGKE